VMSPVDWAGGAVMAKNGSDDDSDDRSDDDDDNSGSGSDNSGRGGSGSSGSGGGNSGSGNSGSGNSGSGSSGSGSSGSGGSGSGGSGSGSSGSGNSGSGKSGSSGSGQSGGGSSGRSGNDDLFSRNMLALHFVDGSVQRIAGGVYEAMDGRGRVLERHRATRRDLDRLQDLRNQTAKNRRQAGVASVALVNSAQAAVQIVDSGGWVEELQSDKYVLRDPNGNTVVTRTATASDLSRLRVFIGEP
ncbi:MAG: hypothetical protein WBN04_06085, partial [Paracoccaceae bacterium]